MAFGLFASTSKKRTKLITDTLNENQEYIQFYKLNRQEIETKVHEKLKDTPLSEIPHGVLNELYLAYQAMCFAKIDALGKTKRAPLYKDQWNEVNTFVAFMQKKIANVELIVKSVDISEDMNEFSRTENERIIKEFIRMNRLLIKPKDKVDYVQRQMLDKLCFDKRIVTPIELRAAFTEITKNL